MAIAALLLDGWPYGGMKAPRGSVGMATCPAFGSVTPVDGFAVPDGDE